MRTLTTTRSGFSLVEMLVYVALLVVVTAAAIASILNFSGAFVQYKMEKLLTSQLHEVVERIQYDIRNASAVNVVGSVLGATPGTLMLDSVGSSVTYELSGGVVTVQENAAPTNPVTGGVVTIDALTFTRFANAATELVQVSITATVTVGDYSKTETYQTSAQLRGSYE